MAKSKSTQSIGANNRDGLYFILLTLAQMLVNCINCTFKYNILKSTKLFFLFQSPNRGNRNIFFFFLEKVILGRGNELNNIQKKNFTR